MLVPLFPPRLAALAAVLLSAVGVSACESGPPALPADATVTSSDAPGTPDAGTPDVPTGPLPAVVLPARLGETLPAAVGGVARATLVAEQDSAMGLSVSRAEATYGTGASAVTLLVLDVGSAEGARLMGLSAPTGRTLDGRPAARTTTATGASVRVHAGDRYVVEARGPDAAALDAYVRAADLGGLPGAE